MRKGLREERCPELLSSEVISSFSFFLHQTSNSSINQAGRAGFVIVVPAGSGMSRMHWLTISCATSPQYVRNRAIGLSTYPNGLR